MDNAVDNSMGSALVNSVEEGKALAPHTGHRYNLRSTSNVHEVPRILPIPIEYT